MLWIGEKRISKIWIGNKPVSALYRGAVKVWEAISSCFGSGWWRSDDSWSNEDSWLN